MNQMQNSVSLPHQWKNGEKDKTIDQELLEVVKQNEWMSPSEIYSEYSHRNKDAVTQQTVSKYLNELERLGELKAKGKSNQRRYRRADKPLQETREDYSSPLSEGLPGFMERRVQREVEKRAQQIEEELREKLGKELRSLENRVDNRINRAAKQSVDVTDRQKNLDNHTEVIYQILKEDGGVMRMKELKQEYKKRIENPLSRRSLLRKINTLQDRGKVEKTGKTSGTGYKAT